MDAQTEPRGVKPLTHEETRLIVFGVLLPVLMGSMDQTILASALPTISRDLGDAANVPWLITVYLLASTAATPLYGKIADIYGRQFTLRIAIVLYMVGSLLCALSTSMLMLIFSRVLQGMGGGGLTSLAIVILGDIVAPKERGRYYTYFSVAYTTAGTCGPALGGFLSDHLHWSAIFWINIPLGFLALGVTSILLRRLPRHERPHRLDVLGAVLIVTASVSFMLAVNLGGVRYPWLSFQVVSLFVCAAMFGAGFVIRLMTAPEPLIPIAILTNPVVRWTVIANAFGWGCIVGLNIFLPIYLQSVMRFSPTDAGLSMIVLMVALNTSAGLAGLVVGRVERYKLLPMASLLLSIAAIATLAWRAEDISPIMFEILLIVIGVGFGPLPALTMVTLQNAVARHQLGIAVGTTNFSRNLLSTILVAIFGALVLASLSSATPGGLAPNILGSASPAATAEAAQAFSRVFLAAAASLAVALVALFFLEEKPLRTDAVPQT